MHIAAVTIETGLLSSGPATLYRQLPHQNKNLLRSRMFLCTNQIKKLGSLNRRPRIEVNVLVYAMRQFIAHHILSTHVTSRNLYAILHCVYSVTGTCF